MRPTKPFGQGGELWEASDQGYTPEGGVDQWPGATTGDPSGVPEPIWNAPATSGFAPGEWDQVPGGFGQDPKDGGGFQHGGLPPAAYGIGPDPYGRQPGDPMYNTAGIRPETPISTTVPQDGGGFQAPPPTRQQQYEAAMTVPVGEDPLSQYTDQTLTNLVTSGQGVLGNQAQGVLSNLMSTGGVMAPYNPQTGAGRGARAGIEQIFQQGGFDPSVFRTALGGQVQGQLGQIIAQGGERPAHQAVQEAQQGLAEMRALGRPLTPAEQAMQESWLQTVQASGQLEQSELAQTSEQALQNIIQQAGMPLYSHQQSDLGAETGQQISALLANQGRLPEDLQREAMQLEAARSPLDAMRRAQMAQGAAALADRGLVGSGAGREYLEGLEERLAPQYTQAAQQIEEQRRQADDQRYSQALGLGAQRGGQLESLGQQSLQSALGQAGQQTAQQEGLEQTERQHAQSGTAQFGTDLWQQDQQQKQFAVSGQQQLGMQSDQMRDARVNQAMEQGQQFSQQEAAERKEMYITGLQQGEGLNRDEAMRAHQNQSMAIQEATGMDAQRIENLLATATTVNDRQRLLTDIASRSLGQNMEWNKFIATFNLDRTMAQEEIKGRQLDRLLPFLQMYTRTMEGLNQGYTFHDPELTDWISTLRDNYGNWETQNDDVDNTGTGNPTGPEVPPPVNCATADCVSWRTASQDGTCSNARPDCPPPS